MQSAAQLVYRVQPAQPCTASDAASALRKLLYAPPLLENRCARAQDLAAPRVYCLLKSMRRPPQRQLCRSPESPPFVFKEKVGVGLFCELWREDKHVCHCLRTQYNLFDQLDRPIGRRRRRRRVRIVAASCSMNCATCSEASRRTMSLSLSWVDSSAHARATSACVAALISSTTYLRLAPAPITHNNYTQVR